MREKILKSIRNVLAGSCSLVICSALQKMILGFEVFKLIGYIIPICYGGTMGLVVGILFSKIEDLNTKLRIKVALYEKILPICSFCNKIRNVKNDQWMKIDHYLIENCDLEFSHSFCPDCGNTHYPDLYEEKEEEYVTL